MSGKSSPRCKVLGVSFICCAASATSACRSANLPVEAARRSHGRHTVSAHRTIRACKPPSTVAAPSVARLETRSLPATAARSDSLFAGTKLVLSDGRHHLLFVPGLIIFFQRHTPAPAWPAGPPAGIFFSTVSSRSISIRHLALLRSICPNYFCNRGTWPPRCSSAAISINLQCRLKDIEDESDIIETRCKATSRRKCGRLRGRYVRTSIIRLNIIEKVLVARE
jgi:hypothetical protein